MEYAFVLFPDLVQDVAINMLALLIFTVILGVLIHTTDQSGQ